MALISFTKLLHPNTVVRILYLDPSRHVRAFWKVPKNGKVVIDGIPHTIDEKAPVLKSGRYNLYLFSYSHIKAVDMTDPIVVDCWDGILDDFRVLKQLADKNEPAATKLLSDMQGELELLQAQKDRYALDPYSFPRETTPPEDIQTILESSWLRDIVQAVKAGFGKRQLMMAVAGVVVLGVIVYFLWSKFDQLQQQVSEMHDMLQTLIGGSGA